MKYFLSQATYDLKEEIGKAEGPIKEETSIRGVRVTRDRGDCFIVSFISTIIVAQLHGIDADTLSHRIVWVRLSSNGRYCCA